ncbi:CmpA/NrtA family ABC transporter substrate-binding protein [Lentisphaera marina]|jgi:nitrate/nitrite transport system substrate-binding protein|uniref:CmpA/NrtA family ABC transporter substrate-binding protein n=1 Tax=Lentisphaera marina TaxID=1111041 RepID=UPI0023668658|nr:CmpA/NrtA family ABC transporter substrate-binding protein [Lentisphaera marina]MDD7983710.1 CmpA/NrtA family ABC transporter substrate-binding protein [Lentisphaera marina]
MSIKSLGNPFDGDKSLTHTVNCKCESCCAEKSSMVPLTDKERTIALEKQAESMETVSSKDFNKSTTDEGLKSSDDYFDRAIESALIRGIFGHNDASRRSFLKLVGTGTFASVLSTMFPMNDLKAQAKESIGKLEKKKLKIGFVPITCATPIIMAKPMGFYDKYGLDVDVIKTAGWAVARDKSLNGEYDASHMLTPMPLAMTMGAGSIAEPYIMPTVENINGQAIVLHTKHKNKRNPKDWKGFKFGVPFDYSMHNLLLRYYVAEHGLDPDKDIQIRVVPPPEMVANLRAGNLDGYLSPDPFNQRAVYEKVGFLHMLTKDIWEGHPCCAFACPLKFAQEMPNTFGALFRSIIDATEFSAKAENRADIAKAISPKNYLNQPEVVVRQVLTGRYVDGLERKVFNEPDRIDFDPFPWHSMAIWILTQMKRWGYVKGDVDYKAIAEQVYIATDTAKVMKELGFEPPKTTYKKHTIMGKEFDYAKPEEYINSFSIKR